MRLGPVSRHDAPRIAQLGLPDSDRNLPFVLIDDGALKAMFDHATEGYPVEIAGYVVGLPLVDAATEQFCTRISHVVRAECESTRTHVTLLPQGLQKVQELCDTTELILVGYYHSHPGFSVFQSGEDLRTYSDYYPENYQIAIVVDPTLTKVESLRADEPWIGFFAWDKDHAPRRLPADHILTTEQVPYPIVTKEDDSDGLDETSAEFPNPTEPVLADIDPAAKDADSGTKYSISVDFEFGHVAWRKNLAGVLRSPRIQHKKKPG